MNNISALEHFKIQVTAFFNRCVETIPRLFCCWFCRRQPPELVRTRLPSNDAGLTRENSRPIVNRRAEASTDTIRGLTHSSTTAARSPDRAGTGNPDMPGPSGNNSQSEPSTSGAKAQLFGLNKVHYNTLDRLGVFQPITTTIGDFNNKRAFWHAKLPTCDKKSATDNHALPKAITSPDENFSLYPGKTEELEEFCKNMALKHLVFEQALEVARLWQIAEPDNDPMLEQAARAIDAYFCDLQKQITALVGNSAPIITAMINQLSAENWQTYSSMMNRVKPVISKEAERETKTKKTAAYNTAGENEFAKCTRRTIGTLKINGLQGKNFVESGFFNREEILAIGSESNDDNELFVVNALSKANDYVQFEKHLLKRTAQHRKGQQRR